MNSRELKLLSMHDSLKRLTAGLFNALTWQMLQQPLNSKVLQNPVDDVVIGSDYVSFISGPGLGKQPSCNTFPT